jgi:HEAT repeat protein
MMFCVPKANWLNWFLGWMLLAWVPVHSLGQDALIETDPSMQWTHLTDPFIELKEAEIYWPEELLRSWFPALKHEESDLRREAADSIAQAVSRGMPPQEPLVELLVQVLETENESPVTRTAAARALVALEAKSQAPVLAKHAAKGPQALTLIVEPMLALWDHQPMRDVWLARLESSAANSSLQKVAIESLGKVGEIRAVPRLSQIALSAVAAGTRRLQAAEALAQLANEAELLAWSQQLMTGVSSAPGLDGLVGVKLLQRLTSSDAIALLDAYAQRAEPTIAAAAMEQLLAKEPTRLVSRADQTSTNNDANIRLITVKALRTAAEENSVRLLDSLLNDPVPQVREEARRVQLTHAAESHLKELVIALAEERVQTEAWRGLEQTIIILTALRQLQVGDRLLALLNHERPEVYVAAAWGLKTMADPEQAEAIHAAMMAANSIMAGGGLPGRKNEMFTHLIEAVGILRVAAAKDHLVTMIPKNAPYDRLPRTAAIWALGYLLEGNPDAKVVAALEERLNDANSTPAEAEMVRGLSAIALGRMGAQDALDSLRLWYRNEGANTFIGRRSGKGVEWLTGEPLVEAGIPYQRSAGWFLQPIPAQ